MESKKSITEASEAKKQYLRPMIEVKCILEMQGFMSVGGGKLSDEDDDIFGDESIDD